MKTAKKKKEKNKSIIKGVDTSHIIRMTNYLNLACLITALWETNILEDRELKKEEVLKVIEAYKIYLQEAADHRQTVLGAVEACKFLSGFDVIEIIDEVFGGKLI